MSLDYNKMYDGELWNVMVQRMTSSISGTGTQEYRIYAGLQEEDIIKTLSYTTMSISGGAAGGGTLSSSLSEIRAWSTPLSASKFRLHTLNKFSTVGNTINSDKEELVYHFKLNENYSSASVSSSTQHLSIVDSAPKTFLTTDYTIAAHATLTDRITVTFGTAPAAATTVANLPIAADSIEIYVDNWYDIQPVHESNQYLADDVPMSEHNIYTVPIHQRTDNFTLRVFSDSPFPVSLTSMMWEGNYSPRFYRRSMVWGKTLNSESFKSC